MNLTFAVERLLQTGWHPGHDIDLERLPDGRPYPSVPAVQREFAAAGLALSIQHNPQFNCYRAMWRVADEGGFDAKDPGRQGTVIGACPREAAVYALANLRETQSPRHLVPA